MAARTRKQRVDDFTRERIRTGLLVNRLENHVLGEVEMSATQVSAALGLLKKSLADLQSIAHSGDQDKPIKHVFTWQNG
jgi:hypothetical protein